MMDNENDDMGKMEEVKDWRLADINIGAADPSNHSMPAVEEVLTQVGRRGSNGKRISKKWWVLAVAVLVVLVVVIPVAVVETHSKSTSSTRKDSGGDGPIDKNDDNEGEKDEDEDINHTGSENSQGGGDGGDDSGGSSGGDVLSGRNAGFSEVVDYLVEQDVSHRSILETGNTPQNRAAKWIANADKFNLAIPTTARDDYGEGYLYVVRYVMAVNFFAMHGHDWDRNLYFMTNRDVCDWHNLSENQGIFCATDGPLAGLPIEFLMFENGLRGQFPGKENGRLITLQTLNVRNNDLSGSIPIEVCNMKSLQKLEMNENNIGESIPWCLSLLDLEELYLHDNNLVGSIPSEFSNLKNLTDFSVSDNMLTGNPIEVFNGMTSLIDLLASDNQFSGTIDETFLDEVEQIYWVDISHNSFTSTTFPSHLFSKTYLNLLDMASNQLAGSLPDGIPVNRRLGFFAVYENQIGGTIPANLKNLQSLVHLDLSSNSFDGPIPEELAEIEGLWVLFLSNNPNLDSGVVPDTFAGLTELRELSLRNTNREGPLPEFIGSNLDKLYLLDLGSNGFTGSIPSNYGSLSAMSYLVLNDNAITGELPATFANLTDLYGVFLDGTELTGDINVFCDLPYFQDLDGDQFVFADCEGDVPEIECLCAFDCQCCEAGAERGCSQPKLANLDGSWENGFRRRPFEFEWSDSD